MPASYPLGWLPDPYSYEKGHPKQGARHLDWDANILLAKYAEGKPASWTLMPMVAGVLDQKSIGSCVSNAGFQAVRMRQIAQIAQAHVLDVREVVKRGLVPPLGSRLWGYWIARSYHGMEDWDSGTHIRSFFRGLNSFGFLPEENYSCKYDVERFADKPTKLDRHYAHDQRDVDNPAKYWRIYAEGEDRIEEIQRAIWAGYVVVFGTDVTKDFAKGALDFNLPVPCPTVNDPIAGGHAMTVVGYDEEGATIVNSWSELWGNKGFAKLSWNYIAWSETQDLWIVETAPMYSDF